MERELTVRQRRFAAGVASGLSRVAAHAAAYPNNMNRGTREVAAKKLAKKPKVRAEIERLTLELLPPVQDMRAAYHHAFSTIVQLTLESSDDRLRFDAARWLRAEYEKREQLSEEARPERTAEVVVEQEVLLNLRRLYEKALGPRDAHSPLVLEEDAQGETAAGLSEAPSERAEPVPAREAAGLDCGSTDTGPEPMEGPAVFRREAVPGAFPPKFRQVRVR